MQYPYTLSDLVPLSQRVDVEGSVHAVYQLPAPKQWTFRRYLDEECNVFVDSVREVVKVRVSLFVDETKLPAAAVIPFDETGKENRSGSVFMDGVVSFQGVLDRLGFAPVVELN